MNASSRKTIFLVIAFLCTAAASGLIGYNTGLKHNDPPAPSPYPVDSSYTVSIERAKNYVGNYSSDSVTQFFGLLGQKELTVNVVPNSRCYWFPAWRMQALLDQIKADSGSGVRFYLAAYNQKYVRDSFAGQEPAPDSSFWGLNTLLFVPTRDRISGTDTIHFDYYLSLSGKNPGRNLILDASSVDNNGEMCPPPSNCAAVGATLLQK